MKKSYILAVLIAVGAVLWIASGMIASAPHETPVPAQTVQKDSAPPRVRVRDSIAETMTAHINVTGRTQAARAVAMKAEIAGQVIEIMADKGTPVAAGQVIAKLDERDRRARLAEAEQRVNQRDIEYNAAHALEGKGFNSKVKLAQARADLEAARAETSKARVDLENTEIRAPFAGIIATQMIEVGDYVDIGTAAFTIVELDPIELAGFVTEKQVAAISPEAPVTAQLLSGVTVEGRLTYIAPAANPETRTFPIEVTVPNPGMKIVEGMTATLNIPLAQAKAHRISPSILTLDDDGRVGVKTVDVDNKVAFTPVTIIADEPDHMWIGGLPDKARLITVGQDYVIPGQVVTPVTGEGDGLL
jgi:multidrug efflux system membrane fusion protein